VLALRLIVVRPVRGGRGTRCLGGACRLGLLGGVPALGAAAPDDPADPEACAEADQGCDDDECERLGDEPTHADLQVSAAAVCCGVWCADDVATRRADPAEKGWTAPIAIERGKLSHIALTRAFLAR